MRRRRHDDQQRALPRPARAGARRAGPSAASTAPGSRRRSTRSASWLDVAPIRPRRRRAPRGGSRRRSRARAAGHDRADGGEHHRRLPRLRLLQHRLPATGPSTRRSTRVLPWAQRDFGARRARRLRGRADRHRRRPRASACSAATGRAASSSRSRPARSWSRPAPSARAGCCSAAGSAATASAQGCTSTSTRRSPPTSRTRSTRSPASRCRTPTSRAAAPPRLPLETWFNPPATQALAMPGWFDHHFENMLRYRHMACAGVLVGTTTPGRVKASAGRAGDRVHARRATTSDASSTGLERRGPDLLARPAPSA